jgi:hypothetical protein
MGTAVQTHSNQEFHRDLVPDDQIATGAANVGDVPVSDGAGSRAWGPGGGGSGSALVLTYDDANFTNADPGAGKFRFDNAAPTIATEFYIDDLDANAISIRPWIDTWPLEGGSIHGYLRLRSNSAPATFILFRITDGLYQGNGGWSTFSVVYVGGVSPLTTAGDTGVEFWPDSYPGLPDILDIPTAEMDATLVLAPDGAGGVEFRAEVGGGGTPAADPGDIADPTIATAEDVALKLNALMAAMRTAGSLV